jgi:phosphotransferase system HPr (HPr) family protein
VKDPSSATQPPWLEGRFTVAQELGFHLRPAGRFVRLASRFESQIEVALARGDWVSGESLLALASLGASKGVELRVRAAGVDAEEAVASLGRLIEDPVEPVAD